MALEIGYPSGRASTQAARCPEAGAMNARSPDRPGDPHRRAAASEGTVQRHLAARGVRRSDVGPGAAIGRFEAKAPNHLSMADCLHQPKVALRDSAAAKHKAICVAVERPTRA